MVEGKIYLSGPITGIDNYLENFDICEKHLRSLGYTDIYNPADDLKEAAEYLSYEELMHVCIRELDSCEEIVMMPGWEKSIGCNREIGYAMGKGIKISKLNMEALEWNSMN